MLTLLLLATWNGQFKISESTHGFHSDVWEKNSRTEQAIEGWADLL